MEACSAFNFTMETKLNSESAAKLHIHCTELSDAMLGMKLTPKSC